MPERITNCPRCNSTNLIEVKNFTRFNQLNPINGIQLQFIIVAKCMYCSHQFEFETIPEYGDI